MSIHNSLRQSKGQSGHRNVLTREERLQKLKENGRWGDGDSLLGIPKVRSIKIAVKKKVKEPKADDKAAEVKK